MRVVPGIYQLRIRLRRARAITVGALGPCRLPAGWYIYTGSARSGLAQRVSRHLRHDKRKQWHIDYLLAVAGGVEPLVRREQRWPSVSFTEPWLAGGCRSHLAYFARQPRIGLMAWGQFCRRNEIV